MGKKSLGVIGGMGPLATSVFFEKIIENTVANSDQEHINMVILNHAELPDRTKVILNQQEALFLNAVQKDIQLLETAGVAHIAIPCNTSHFFYDQMQEMTNVPIIHMVEETCKAIHRRFGDNSKVAILATNGTVQSGIYRMVCEKYNMKLHTPNQVSQEQVMNTIYSIKSDLKVDETAIEQIIKELVYEENCCCVILACTELSCMNLSDEVSQLCIDAMDVLVEKSIELSGGKVKHPTNWL